MKKLFVFIFFCVMITFFVVYKSSPEDQIPIDQLNLDNSKVITESGLEIPIDSVLKYYNPPLPESFISSSKVLIIREENNHRDQFKKAIKRYLINDSIRKAKQRVEQK